MADELQFIRNGLQRQQIDEFFQEELGRAGYGGMELAKTPMGTQIVLKAEKPGMVIGKGGKNIRAITSELETRFDLEDPQIDVQEVEEPDLNAQIVADRLANALERGWYFRKAGHTTVERIMEAGALGAEIELTGKVTGARGRHERFNRGYIKHNGEPAEAIVDKGQSLSVMKLGTIGVKVKIIPPNAELPDDFRIRDDVDIEEVAPSGGDEGVEDLIEAPDEDELAAVDAEAAAVEEAVAEETATPEEEVIEEEVVEPEPEPEPEPAADADEEATTAAAAEETAEDVDIDESEVEAIMAELEGDEEGAD